MVDAYGGMLFLAEILLVALKLLYYSGESIYRLFVPVEEKSVAGEIALITGAAHGLGKEMALKYASLGATVVCWDIDAKANEETVKEIKNTGTATAYGYKCNVSNYEEVFQVAERVRREVGNVTILVNNAGIIPYLPFTDYKPEDLKRIVDVNIMAHFWTIQAFLPSMVENNYGHIVAISSLAGMMGFAYMAPYCATKFAVRGLMRALADEISMLNNGKTSNVKFTTIFPSLVSTDPIKPVNTNSTHLMPITTVQQAVHEIITAQRRNYREQGVPAYMLYTSNMSWSIPNKALNSIKRLYYASVKFHTSSWSLRDYNNVSD